MKNRSHKRGVSGFKRKLEKLTKEDEFFLQYN